MLAETAGIQKIILAVGYTDLRKGVDSLAQMIGTKYDLNSFEKDILFLFCGRRTDRIKGLIWEGNGFLLLYKRLEDGAFSWPRTPEEAAQLTPEEYKQLMMRLNPLHPKIRDVRISICLHYAFTPRITSQIRSTSSMTCELPEKLTLDGFPV